MNSVGLGILIVLSIVAAVILYRIFKPYFIRYDTTITVNGGLGSGKTLTCVKIAIILIRKQRLKIWAFNHIKQPIQKFIYTKINNHRIKQNAKHIKDKNWQIKGLFKIPTKRKKPLLYSNIPIHFKKHIFSKKREWSVRLEASQLILLKEIREYSVVFVDELAQFINQFNWKEELIQNNVNEWITFFRHYIGGYFITNSQATEDIVVQIRRKLNQAIWCFNFKKWGWPIPLFYTIRMCDILLNDQIGTVSTTFIEENTKLHFGLFPARNTYDTRCYRPRRDNMYIKENSNELEKINKAKKERWKQLQTTKVIRLMEYDSPLDDKRTEEEKKNQWEKGEKIWNN